MCGSGQPMLLLHGFSGSGQNWAEIAEALQDKYLVIMPDLLGQGRSESPPSPTRYQIDFATQDLIALLQSLNIDKVHLLGYSMGGRLALALALEYPEPIKTLTLESASPGLESQSERVVRVRADEVLAARIEREGVAWFAAYWEALPLFSTQAPEIRAKLREIRLANTPMGLANSLRGMGTGAQPSFWARLAELKIPTLLIVGEKDEKFTDIAQRMAELVPSAHLSIVSNSGHTIHQEQPEQYIRVVRAFLDSQSLRAGDQNSSVL